LGTYSFTAAQGQNGYQYRAVFSNSSGTTTTTAATLTVQASQSAPVVTQNPADVSVAPGATVTFTAAAIGNPTPTVQWQSGTGTNPFADIPGATSTTYTFTAATNQNGNRYQAMFKNPAGSVTTVPATLTVTSVPTIRSVQPVLPSFLGAAGFGANM